MSKRALLGQFNDIDIRRLRIFKVVTEAGGISAAELELNIGRSTISTHIKDLEFRLGVTLCHRGRSGFSLTEEGRHIYKSTLSLLGSIDQFRIDIGGMNNSLTGQINIALFDKTVSNPESRIASAFKKFDAIAPDVNLTVYVESLNEIERGIMEGRFQIGVIPGHRSSPSLSYTSLFNEKVSLYCGKDHPLFNTPDENIDDKAILSYKYAELGYHSPNMEFGRSLGMLKKASAYDQEAIAHLLLSGCYIAFLPNHYAEQFVGQKLIRRIRMEQYSYNCDFLAIQRTSPKPSRLIQTFLDCLVDAHKD